MQRDPINYTRSRKSRIRMSQIFTLVEPNPPQQIFLIDADV